MNLATRVAVQWRKARPSGFHGWKMTPESMRLPGPEFTDKKPIPKEDVDEAIGYLEEIRPGVLVAYSRGGAVAMLALRKHKGARPKIIYVAPAWQRGWANVHPPNVNGVILHGDKDNAVPLQHSCELADETGLPLRVVEDRNHVSILKDKENPNAGKLVPQGKVTECVKTMPDWGQGGRGSPDEVRQQEEFYDRLASRVASRYIGKADLQQ